MLWKEVSEVKYSLTRNDFLNYFRGQSWSASLRLPGKGARWVFNAGGPMADDGMGAGEETLMMVLVKETDGR